MARLSTRDRLLRIAGTGGLVNARDVAAQGIHTQMLSRMVEQGALDRVSRGLYRLAGRPISEHHGLALAASVAPHGIVCLLSALSFHGLGTQLPAEVWLALDRRSRTPALSYPRLRIVRFTGDALTAGVETHKIEGRPVRVYDVAKTLADCFKYRNKIGLDVVLEALNDAWRKRRFRMQALERYGDICRVRRIMQPYVEALVA
jgi:predicted transcriptional regulator of viral defense system